MEVRIPKIICDLSSFAVNQGDHSARKMTQMGYFRSTGLSQGRIGKHNMTIKLTVLKGDKRKLVLTQTCILVNSALG